MKELMIPFLAVPLLVLLKLYTTSPLVKWAVIGTMVAICVAIVYTFEPPKPQDSKRP